MAANKFATMLHKNCHKIIVILVYAVLEWILILLLLLNSLFSYLIGKFAKFFGLKPSCTWCSRLDHIFDSKNITKSCHFDHVCEAHGAEISKLTYCSNHKRLAESKKLCSDCSSSSPVDHGMINEIAATVAFFAWMSEEISEKSEENRCSCCDEILSRKVYSPSLIFKPSLDVLDYIRKKVSLSEADLVKYKIEFEEKGRNDDNDDPMAFEKDDQLQFDGCKKTDIVEEFLCDSNHGNRCEKLDSFEVQEWDSSQTDDPFSNLGCNEDDESAFIADMLLHDAEYMDSDRFICIELIDTASISSEKPLTNGFEDVEEGRGDKQGQLVEEANDASNRRFGSQRGSDTDAILSSSGLMEEYEKRDKEAEKFTTPSREKDDAEAEEVEDPDKFSEPGHKDYNMPKSNACAQAVGGTILRHSKDTELFFNDSTNIGQSKEHETSNQLGEEAEEKRDSPEVTITDGLLQVHDKLIMLEKVGSGQEDCWDGTMISDMEVGIDSLTVELLKTRLIEQQEVLNALYAEVEEERKAAAEAANETMAMITKLQEEKGAMQMEALQYQRMMEEQAEYDQEALQLLNDLMIKREKEKKELEKELEIYKSKVLDYEARETTTIVRRRKGSLRSLGHCESNDNHSIDLNCEDECDDGRFGTHQEHDLDDSWEDLEETGVECITNLTIPDVSLAEFDEERLSILEELKILEAKLFALHDDETQLSDDEKGTLNSSDHERETVDLMAKKLLPLFDATENEFADEEFDKEESSNHSSGMTNQFCSGAELENRKIAIQEEFGHVYERLQALEADKDFLKHCIRSMMKGNKGLPLLQEILQHLRDLKSVELSARNLAEVPLSDVSMIREDQE